VSPTLGVVTLVLITVVWGSTFAIVKDALDTIPVSLLLAVRFSLAAACFSFVRFDRRALWPSLWLGLLAFAGFASQTIGLSLTSASNAAFITGLAVVLTPMVAAVAWRRSVAPRAYLAALVATAGLGLLTLGEGGLAAVNAGDVWVLVTALAYALYIVYLGEVAGRASVFSLAGMQHLPMALLAWAWAWPERGALVDVPLATYGAIAYLAVVATALVAVLQVAAQRVRAGVRRRLRRLVARRAAAAIWMARGRAGAARDAGQRAAALAGAAASRTAAGRLSPRLHLTPGIPGRSAAAATRRG